MPRAEPPYETGLGVPSGDGAPSSMVSGAAARSASRRGARVRMMISEEPAGRSRMVIVMTFPSADAMDLLVGMGFEQGLSTAVGQIDAVLG